MRAVSLDAGRIVLDGAEISRVKGKQLKALRSAMQFVFEDPYGALDPKMRPAAAWSHRCATTG